jgi:uncharacterized protein (TIGR00730 family)
MRESKFGHICVFCGSTFGARAAYREAAVTLGRLMAERGIGLVYGGGSVGLMGVVADSALACNGTVHGVIPEALSAKEIAHQKLTRMDVVPNMHARKARLMELTDAFVALPGGYGTLEELFEVTAWAQLGLHRKPIALLNVSGYFDPLIRLIDGAVAEGFVEPLYRRIITSADTPAGVLEALERHEPPTVPRYITARDT